VKDHSRHVRGHRGVTVNAVVLGLMETPQTGMIARALFSADEDDY